jgi:hypothetical protein
MDSVMLSRLLKRLLGVMAQNCNPSTWEAEAGGAKVSYQCVFTKQTKKQGM